MTNPPPSLPRQSRTGFGWLLHQPEQNSSQQFALLKLQAFKNKTKEERRKHPWVCFLIKSDMNWNPLLCCSTRGCVADQKLADLLNSLFIFIYSWNANIGSCAFWLNPSEAAPTGSLMLQGLPWTGLCLHVSPGSVIWSRQGELWPQPPQEGDGKLSWLGAQN